VALARAEARGNGEDRFEKKGNDYHEKVRTAFRQIAQSNSESYRLIDASGSIDEVSDKIFQAIEETFSLKLSALAAETP
jgi:dTMP kinase